MGARDDERGSGPDVHLIASYPADGQGTNAAADAAPDCDDASPGCPVPTNAALELRFDRFLLPGGGLAAGLSLYSGNPPANGVALSARYDLLERVVVLRPLRPLQDNTLYTAEIAPSSDVRRGFWAFDGAPLTPGPIPLRFSFKTGSGARPTPVAPPRLLDDCQSMSQGPFAICADCHATRPSEPGEPNHFPPMRLDLASARGLFETAIGHVAHQTQVGNALNDEGLRTPVRFGVQMNLIDPGNPATSYLVYKLLAKSQNFRPGPDSAAAGCNSGYHVPVADRACSAPDTEELHRLREWFVLGEPMPKDAPSSAGAVESRALDRPQLERIVGWIGSGAPCGAP